MNSKQAGTIAQMFIKFLCVVITSLIGVILFFHENKIIFNREKISENSMAIHEQYKEINNQLTDVKDNINIKLDTIINRQSLSNVEFSGRLSKIEAKL